MPTDLVRYTNSIREDGFFFFTRRYHIAIIPTIVIAFDKNDDMGFGIAWLFWSIGWLRRAE